MKKIVSKKRKNLHCIKLICWIILPLSITALLILDGLSIYIFNTQRLIVIGACIIVLLIPFFSEVTIKNFSIKKDNKIK